MYFLNFKNYGWNFITQSWTCLCLIPLLLLFILHKYFSNSSLIFVSNFYFSLSESLIPVLSLLFLNSNFPIDFGYFSCILIFKLLVFLLIYFYFIKKLWFAFTFTPQELKKNVHEAVLWEIHQCFCFDLGHDQFFMNMSL